MALDAKVITFATGTGTGTLAVTGVGFQPKALIFLGSFRTSVGQAAGANINMGFATGSSARGCLSGYAAGSADPTETYHRPSDVLCYAAINSSGSNRLTLDLVSLDSDGFTVDRLTNNDSADYQVTVLCLGGASLTNAMVLTGTINGSTGSQSFTGAGFQPDCVLGLMTFGGALGFGSSDFQFAFGVATSSSSRASIAVTSDNGVGDTNTRSLLKTGAFLQLCSVSGSDTVAVNNDFTSMDSDGFTIDRVATNFENNPAIFLCLKGASAAIGSVAANTGTGTAAVTGLGFQPSALILASTNGTTSTQTTPNAGLEVAIGMASASTERGSVWAIDEDGLAASDNQTRFDTGALWMDYQGTGGSFAIAGEAELSSFDSDGFTLDTVDAFPAANLAIYLALGPAAAGGPALDDTDQWQSKNEWRGGRGGPTQRAVNLQRGEF